MSNCIDLRPICKERRWKWHYEESFKAEGMWSTNPDAPWYVEVLCQYGTIYPKGGDELLACVEGHGRIVAKLQREVPEVRSHQGNVVFRFPLKCLDAVTAIMRPKKIGGRPADDALRAHLAQYAAPRFQGGSSGSESPNSEGDR